MRRIIIITQRDPFFVNAFLQEFNKFNLPFQIIDLPNFNKGFFWGIKRAKDLYGLLGVMKLSLIALKGIFTSKLHNCTESTKVSSIEEIKDFVNTLDDASIILSLSAPCRIPVEEYDFKGKFVNLHCGKLPDYAGMMPIFWQILNNENKITITLHDVAKDIDSGRILLEKEMNISNTLFKTSVAAKKYSAKIFFDWIEDKENSFNYIKEPNSLILRKFPEKKDINKFKKIYRLI